MKQPAPPPPIFVKVVEIKQKNHIFQCFARWLGLLIFQPCWFKRNITCKLKVSIRRGFWKIVDFWFSENSQEIVYSRVWKGAVLCFESWHLGTLHHLSYGINSKSNQMQRNIMLKNNNTNAKIVSIFPPWWNSLWRGDGAYLTKRFSPQCINK